jgi:hypothetical protein
MVTLGRSQSSSGPELTDLRKCRSSPELKHGPAPLVMTALSSRWRARFRAPEEGLDQRRSQATLVRPIEHNAPRQRPQAAQDEFGHALSCRQLSDIDSLRADRRALWHGARKLHG